MGTQLVLIPINVSTRTIRNNITTAMITATMLIAKAFSHPQLKKCFTRANQITKSIRYDSITEPIKFWRK